jgi:hypothetical protein
MQEWAADLAASVPHQCGVQWPVENHQVHIIDRLYHTQKTKHKAEGKV